MLALKAWRDALRHKGQFLALVALVALGIMSFVTFQNGYYDLANSLDEAYGSLRLSDFTVQVERAPLTLGRSLRGVSGIAEVRVRTVRDVGLLAADGHQATARIVSVPDSGKSGVSEVYLERGRMPVVKSRGEVLLHPKYAGETGTEPGDTLTLRISGKRVKVRVVGIATDPENLYAMRTEGEIPSPGEFAIVYATESEIERLLGTSGSGNEIVARVAPGADAERVMERVEDEVERYGLLSSMLSREAPGYVGLQAELDQNRVMAQSLPVLVLAISVMSIFITLSRLVQSQRGEIGLAKALGYSDGQILGHYLMYGLLIAIGGAILGVGLGLLGAKGTALSYVSILGLPFLTSGFYPGVVAVAAALATAACVGAALVPAYQSARLTPAIAMHADPNKSLSGGKIPLAERLLGPVLPKSFTFRIPLRNVFRARRRSLYTVLGIAFAMVMSVVTIAMFDSIDYLLDKAFTDVERWDVIAAFTQPVGPSKVAEVERMRGVDRVQPAMAFPVTITANDREEDITLTAMRPESDFHGFTQAGGAEPAKALAAGELVLAASTASQLGVSPGAHVRVESPFNDDPVLMTVGALSAEMLGQPAYISLEKASILTGRPTATYNVLYIDTPAGRGAALGDALYDMDDVASVQVKEGLVERLQSLLELFNVFGTILLGFGGALAFVVVFTTFTANVTERTREIATMRTIGEDNPRLAVMVTLENLILAIAALPLGVWLGMRATDAIFARFSTESYTLEGTIYPASIVRICALMLVVLLVSELPPIRRIFRLDLAEATKVME